MHLPSHSIQRIAHECSNSSRHQSRRYWCFGSLLVLLWKRLLYPELVKLSRFKIMRNCLPALHKQLKRELLKTYKLTSHKRKSWQQYKELFQQEKPQVHYKKMQPLPLLACLRQPEGGKEKQIHLHKKRVLVAN